jgi:hypothetical protein
MAKTSDEMREIAREIDTQTECIVAAILAMERTTGGSNYDGRKIGPILFGGVHF